MEIRISVVRKGEESQEVAHLHAAMRELGLEIEKAELEARRAGESTSALVREFQRRMNIPPHDEYLVDEKTAAAMNSFLQARSAAATEQPTYIVRGTVRGPDGQAASGLTVAAFDQDLRTRRALGRAHTGADGTYAIGYSRSALPRDERAADLVLEVSDASGDVLWTSDVQFNASSKLAIDVELPAYGSEAEFDRIARRLRPVLEGQGVSFATLEESPAHRDITFAAAETGLPREWLLAFALAHRLPHAKPLQPEFWYAVLRTQTFAPPTAAPDAEEIGARAHSVLASLPATAPAAVERGLQRALDDNVIASRLRERVSAWLKAYAGVAARAALDGAGGQSGATAIADAAGLPAEKHDAFAGAYVGGGTRSEVLARLRASNAFDEHELAGVETALVLHDLTLGDGPLVKEVKAQVDGPAQVRTLAALAPEDWSAAVARAGSAPPAFVAGATPAEQQRNYGALLAKRFQHAYPTAAFAGGLTRSLKSAQPPAFKHAEQLSTFFDAHPDFELATTSVTGYVNNRANPAFFNAPQKDAVVGELQAAQRVFKLNPSFDAVNSLLADNVHSAHQITRIGKSEFVRSYAEKPGFTKQTAGDTYERALNTIGAVTTMVGDLTATYTANGVSGIANDVPALADFPDLQNLFQGGDACACEHCRSIFGPSAYLADLLAFLELRKTTTPGLFVKDALFQRRPDIGYLELTCENSDTPLPYVDLACEVLEDQVAPWRLFTLPIALQPHLVEGAADATLIAAFAPAVVLSAATTVSKPITAHDGSLAWVVRDANASYRVAATGAGLDVSLLRQTRGTTEELSAAPEYVNDDAYKELRKATTPLALPFDLPTEEVRAYLDRAGITLASLMETFRGTAAPNDATPLDVAAEYVGIAAYEQSLILDHAEANQFHFWGEPDNPSAITSMSKVDVFLKRTGLEYADLQRLLSLAFVNPGGAIVIQHLDASCDLAQKRLQVLDAAALDRIHRFLRLWRKLGWKMWEVDLVIEHSALGKGALDANLVLNLYPFLQLKARLATVSIEQLAAFFGPINTVPKFTEAYKKTEPSLYETLFLNKRLTNPIQPAFAVAAVTAAPGTIVATIDGNLMPIFAALRVSETDLGLLRALRSPAHGPLFIDAKLSLPNLSFLYRHARLAKLLHIKLPDWSTLLYAAQRDPFADPAAALAFVQLVDRLKSSGLTIDQLGYVLTADRSAKSAESEKNVTTLLTTLRKGLQAVAAANAPPLPGTSADALATTAGAQLLTLGWDAASSGALIDVFNGRFVARAVAPSVPAAFAFPAAITSSANIPIAYDGPSHAISFTGILSDAQKTTLLGDPSLAAVTANPEYQAAIDDIHQAPRLLMKFYRPFFETPLATLPAGVNFGDQLAQALAAKVRYDAERAVLAFFGIMSRDERDALGALSADPAYAGAVAALYTLPRTGAVPAAERWLTLADLTLPLGDAANLQANLTLAATRLAAYLARTLAVQLAEQQLSAALRVTPALTAKLLETFALFGHPLLNDYTDPAFVSSSSAITYAGYQQKYDGYFWLHRAALVLRALAITFDELGWAIRDQAATHVLDFATLPVLYDATLPAVASVDALLDLAEFMQRHHGLSGADVSVLGIVDRLITDGAYTNALFAADVETLTGWVASDVTQLTAPGGLDTAYPAGYERIGGWRRLTKAALMLARLNASAQQVLALAAPSVGPGAADAVKQMVRSKYEESDFLTLTKGIQDALRERKRDSLVAYLLSQPMPVGAPTGKWTNANDLYAYNLIDVEMTSCQLTSRIVQASAAVQLFVQRAFMGLEPGVRVSVDVDDGWKQWAWMKYYRVWEANRRVFAFPENYAEPELRLDKSPLFKDLENELLQNEVSRDNVETAYLHYVERLDDIAQLEIAGTYYQDSTKTLHVFGRSAGSDPRVYYYRQFINNRRWTPWSKVDCDFKSDYVVPIVANERLHVVWPEFRQTPVQPGHVDVPTAGASVDLGATDKKPSKTTRVYLAVTEYKNKKWTPKRISADGIDAGTFADGKFDASTWSVLPLDFSWLGGPVLLLVFSGQGKQQVFELADCRGYPEQVPTPLPLQPVLTHFDRDGGQLDFIKNVEHKQGDPLIPRDSLVLLTEILGLTPDRFKISYPHYMSFIDRLFFVLLAFEQAFLSAANIEGRGLMVTLGTFYPWFYADKLRTFFVRPELIALVEKKVFYYEDVVAFIEEIFVLIAANKWKELFAVITYFREDYRFRLRFTPFYHPLTCAFAKSLYANGVEGLVARETQFADKGLDFAATYAPTTVVEDLPVVNPEFAHPHYPHEVVDFDPDGAYSVYNWEIFFHAPLMIASRLSSNQRFEEAMRWFHFIFDPTGGHDKDPVTGLTAAAPQKYWITKPFYRRQSAEYLQQRIENLMQLLGNDPANPTPPDLLQELGRQVDDWRRDPFDPHLIAQFRTVAYQKMTVMKYVDNLIAWGDQLFRQDTMETVNAAAMLYVVAAEILGPRPRKVPPAAKPPAETFNELASKLDAFSNAIVQFENLIPPMGSGGGNGLPPPTPPSLLYFCIPPNDKLLGYWDTVEDRLYKIRHCLNIEGVFQQLPLFAPPIDPGALVRALAGGADLASALADLDAPLPYYRFGTMLQKANELAADVKSLGATLLAALEKNDAEALALLRQGQEIAVLNAVRDVKLKQIDDAQLAIDGLQKNIELVTFRRDYYASREETNAGEKAAIGLSTASTVLDAAIAIGYLAAGGLRLIPQFMIGAAGFGGSPTVNAAEGGEQIAGVADGAVKTLSATATAFDKGAALADKFATYARRKNDWDFQADLAGKELEQLAKQSAAASKKLEIAQNELANHDLQVANAQALSEFMHGKYTNQELYQWMQVQIGQTYFQSYQLAHDLSKRAERSYRFELGVADSAFIQFGYWDNMRSGLQAGERLQLDLRRLESAYLDQNRREFECTKHVSLAMLNPGALLALKDTGMCIVDLPEELFDLDYPGHYFRRIKSVSISIPCVAGPYTTVNCTLRLLKNSIRTNSSAGAQYQHNNDAGVFADDDRFAESHLRVNAIATSTGQNDSGMFELNFRDERYLPFEGAGAISTWQIELMQDRKLRQFDYATITDAIVHVRYTAREDAGEFKKNALQHLDNVLTGVEAGLTFRRAFDLKREFPTEWYAFLHPAVGPAKTLQLGITKQHFPYLAQDATTIQIETLWLFVRSGTQEGLVAKVDPLLPAPDKAHPAADQFSLLPTPVDDVDGFHIGHVENLGVPFDGAQPWTIQLRKLSGTFAGLTDTDVEEAYLVVEYTLQP